MNGPLWPSAADDQEQDLAEFMAAHSELPDDWQPDPEDVAPWWQRDQEF